MVTTWNHVNNDLDAELSPSHGSVRQLLFSLFINHLTSLVVIST
jgi:hypothetical protein